MPPNHQHFGGFGGGGGGAKSGSDLRTQRTAVNHNQEEFVREFLGDVWEKVSQALCLTGFGNFCRPKIRQKIRRKIRHEFRHGNTHLPAPVIAKALQLVSATALACSWCSTRTTTSTSDAKFTVKSAKKIRPDPLQSFRVNFMREIWSVRPKCSYRCGNSL